MKTQQLNSNSSFSHKPNKDFYSPKISKLRSPLKFHICHTTEDIYPRKAKKITKQEQEASLIPKSISSKPGFINLMQGANSNPIEEISPITNREDIFETRTEEALLTFLNNVFFSAIEYENSLANPNASKRPDEISAWFLKEALKITENRLDFYFRNGTTLIFALFNALESLHVSYEFIFIDICLYFIINNIPLKINKHTTLLTHIKNIGGHKSPYSYIYSSIYQRKLHPFSPAIKSKALELFWQELSNNLKQNITNFIRLNIAIKAYTILDNDLKSFQLEHDLKIINSDENDNVQNLAVALLGLMINTLNERIYYMSSWNNLFSKLSRPIRAALIQKFESELNEAFQDKIENFSTNSVFEFIEQINNPTIDLEHTLYISSTDTVAKYSKLYECEAQSLVYNVFFPKYKSYKI